MTDRPPELRLFTDELIVDNFAGGGGATEQDPQLGLPLATVTTKDRFAVVTVAGVDYAIVDIGMRMLSPRELYLAQGFPAGYVIDLEVDGRALTKGAQVRMVGNSVSPWPAAQLVRAQFQARAAAEVA